jgi:hypothetical protein
VVNMGHLLVGRDVNVGTRGLQKLLFNCAHISQLVKAI